MIKRLHFVLGCFVTAGVMLLVLCSTLWSQPEVGMAVPVSNAFDALPPSGAGVLASHASGGYPQNGTRVDENLAEIYIETARKILPDIDPDPQNVANSPEQWVYIQLPKLLSADVNPARALIGSGDASIQPDNFGKINRDTPGVFAGFNDLPPLKNAGKANPGNASSIWILPRQIQGAGAP